MIVGTAAARRASRGLSKSAKQVYFNGEPVSGSFWRCIGLLEAGGLVVDERMGTRLFSQMRLAFDGNNDDVVDVAKKGSKRAGDYFDELSLPVHLREFRRIHGYRPSITSSIDGLVAATIESLLALFLTYSVGARIPVSARREFELTYFRYAQRELDEIFYSIQAAGLTSHEVDIRFLLHEVDRLVDFNFHSRPDLRNMDEYDYYLQRVVHSLDSLAFAADRPHLLGRFLEDIFMQWRRTVERAARKSELIQPPMDLEDPPTDSSGQLFE